MTLEEAIKHCDTVQRTCNNEGCALEYYQLQMWLEELQQYRKNTRKEE